MEAFSVYDSGTESYGQPLFFRAKGEAIRWFSDMANDSKSVIFKHPGDFTLFHIGSFDDFKCQFSQLATPVPLGIAIEYKSKHPSEVMKSPIGSL